MAGDRDKEKTFWSIPRVLRTSNGNTLIHTIENFIFSVFELVLQFFNTFYLSFIKPKAFIKEIGKKGESEKILSPLLYCLMSTFFALLMSSELSKDFSDVGEVAGKFQSILPGTEYDYFVISGISITMLMVFNGLFCGYIFSFFLQLDRTTVTTFCCYTLGTAFIILAIFSEGIISVFNLFLNPSEEWHMIVYIGAYMAVTASLVCIIFFKLILITSRFYAVNLFKVTLVSLFPFMFFMLSISLVTIQLTSIVNNRGSFTLSNPSLYQYDQALDKIHPDSIFITMILENRTKRDIYLLSKRSVSISLTQSNRKTKKVIGIDISTPIHYWEGGELEDVIKIGAKTKKWVMFRWEQYRKDIYRLKQEEGYKHQDIIYISDIRFKSIDDRRTIFYGNNSARIFLHRSQRLWEILLQ